jgi:hypothetical protein
MKRLFVFALSLVALVFIIRYGGGRLLDVYHERSFTSSSEARVNAVLTVVKKHGTRATAEFQGAMCMWYRGVPFVGDTVESRRAELGFITWLHQGKIFEKVESFSITEVEHEQLEDGPRVIVTCTINGKPRRIGVKKKCWAELGRHTLHLASRGGIQQFADRTV